MPAAVPRSGMDPHEAVKALGGIGCHCGTDSCINAVSLVLREVLEHPESCTPLHGSNRKRLKGETSRSCNAP
uniref:Uncharacterized protein n=1 Tax=Geobacter sp. (strain M21) TaxID=443144 RepID=C6DZC7_GEOSM